MKTLVSAWLVDYFCGKNNDKSQAFGYENVNLQHLHADMA